MTDAATTDAARGRLDGMFHTGNHLVVDGGYTVF
jgi:hypothetical protein